MKHPRPSRFSVRRQLLRAACPLFAAALLAGGHQAAAATLTWDPLMNGTGSYGSGTWDAAATTDWATGTGDQVFGTGNTAIFAGTTTGPAPVTLASTVSALAADFTTAGYSIASTATNTLTVTSTGAGAASAIYANGTGGTTTFTGPIIFSTGAAAGTITANTATDVINISGSISQTPTGAAGVSTAGLGTINYSGTALAGGKFNINNAVFNSSGAVTVAANGTYFGIDSATGATLNITAGTFSATAVTTFIGAGTTAAPAPGTINLSGGTNTFTALNVGNGFAGTGDGTGTVTFTGGTNTVNGIIRLGSTNAGVGTLNLNTGGRLIIGAAAGQIVRGTGTTGTGGSGNLNFNGGVLQYNAAPAVPAIAANITTTILDNGATISTNGSNITIASPIGHGGTAAIDGGLTKAANTGILTLTATNTYTGATTVSGGTLAISANGGLSSSNVTVAAGATLSLATGVTAAHSVNTATLTLAGTTSVLNLASTTSGTVQDTVSALIVNGTSLAAGTYVSSTNTTAPAADLTSASITGLGAITVAAVPEPSTWALLAGGFGSLLALTARRKRCV